MRQPPVIAAAVLSLVVTFTFPASAEPLNPSSPPASASEILAKAREKLKDLQRFHFERRTTYEELKSGSDPKTIADLTFITYGEAPKNSKDREQDQPSDESPAPIAQFHPGGRLRFELRAGHHSSLLMGDGKTYWWYSSLHNIYRKADNAMALSESFFGPVLATAHMSPFSNLSEGLTPDAKLAREEEIELGQQRRKCYVITSQVPVRDFQAEIKAGKDGEETANKSDESERFIPTAFMFAQLKSMGYLGKPDDLVRYNNASTPERPQFTQLTLWIDKESLLLARVETIDKMHKWRVIPDEKAPERLGATELKVIDAFTVLKVDESFQDELFNFEPPKGAAELAVPPDERTKN